MKRHATKALMKWMDENGWSQARLAAYLGCSQQWVSQALSEKATWGLEAALLVTELTEIPIEDIVTDRVTQRILEGYVNRLLVRRGIAKENGSVA
jgi:predicted transcriptional regulator